MAGSSLLALIDDIATLLDDVAVLSKLAAKKTAGVLGDDLAVNAEKVSGVSAARELPVVWAVFKGSALNKLILVPVALLISAVAPWAVMPLLMVGGAFLCYEGFEKIAHYWLHRDESEQHHAELVDAVSDPAIDILVFEKEKIKGAIRTDFILSAEIIAITLSTVATEPMLTQVAVVSLIAVLMTFGVYGFVAAIVKIDDAGRFLSHKGGIVGAFGRFLLNWFAPYLMKALSVFGTLAMFMVGGGILAHGIHAVWHWIEHFSLGFGAFSWLISTALTALLGCLAGALVLLLVELGRKAFGAAK